MRIPSAEGMANRKSNDDANGQRGRVRVWLATGLATAMLLEPVTAAAAASATASGALMAPAAPAAFFKKKKKKKKRSASGPAKIGPELSVESANGKRDAIRDAAKGDEESGDFAAAAKTLEDNGALLGDPVVYLEAADLRLQAADKDRDVEQAELAIESSRIAADIAGYYEAVGAGSAESAWLVIDPSTASDLSSRAEAQIAKAEDLIEAIEEEESQSENVAAGPTDKAKKPRKQRGKAKPGTVLIAAGGAMTAVGVAGASMAIAGLVISRGKQDEVDKLMLPADQAEVDRLDKEGNRANTLAFVGMGVAIVGLGVGVPLIVVGAKRRKEAGNAPASATLRIAPRLTRTTAGLSLSGRF